MPNIILDEFALHYFRDEMPKENNSLEYEIDFYDVLEELQNRYNNLIQIIIGEKKAREGKEQDPQMAVYGKGQGGGRRKKTKKRRKKTKKRRRRKKKRTKRKKRKKKKKSRRKRRK